MAFSDHSARHRSEAAGSVSSADYPYFTTKLQARLDFIRSNDRSVTARSKSEQLNEPSGEVHDQKDDAFADSQAEAELVRIAHETQELRDIELAQCRIRDSEYGHCLDCGSSMEWERLDAYPTALRCITCQERQEQKDKPQR